MAIFKCKMCGGDLEISAGVTVAECEYCGTQQTLPRLDDQRKANLYDRANHFRRNNDFDKAMGIYEQILNEDSADAEAYWSLVLCRYGIEYVEDPISRKRLPTINRAQFTSVFDDNNYKAAIENADSQQKTLYEAEAKAINEIQRGILAISQKEDPFDVFICYKETDNNGRRTPDSVLAQELYFQLVQEGYKVFFSRITLEDKLGSAYEPYIFAALNSAKVMVVLGTKAEHFKAVWVRNEWSRYLSLIKAGAKKMLIPAYKDMDPYDLPEEFSHLQAQDMSRLGFMQDLIRGITKILGAGAPKATVVMDTVPVVANTNTTPLLERAFMFLEDGDWERADEFCEQVLNIEPKNAQAYLGKLMAELRVKTQEGLKDCANPFDENNNYQKAVRFADDALKNTLTGCIEYINTRNENARLDGIYTRATNLMNSEKTEASFKEAARLFESIPEYQDSTSLAKECYEKATAAHKDTILADGKARMKQDYFLAYEGAIKLFKTIPGWKDADELLVICQQKLDEIEKQKELAHQKAIARKKRNNWIARIVILIILAVFLFVIINSVYLAPKRKYNKAVALMEDGNIIEAYDTLIALDDYKDSAKKASSIYDQYKLEKLKHAKVGDYVFFGAYEQDNNLFNGKEEIEWLVLEVKNGKALVISKYGLDCASYNTDGATGSWGHCALRNWLNSGFVRTVFTADEKDMISNVTIAGSDTLSKDKVFILSEDQVKQYFKTNIDRQCKPTDYAIANGASITGTGNCYYWLRNPGYIINAIGTTVYVGEYGNGYSGYNSDIAVRPAMWIDLSKIQ